MCPFIFSVPDFGHYNFSDVTDIISVSLLLGSRTGKINLFQAREYLVS